MNNAEKHNAFIDMTRNIQRIHAFDIAVKKVQQQTSDNDHTNAIVTIADYIAQTPQGRGVQSARNLASAARALETLHSFYGYFTLNIAGIRTDILRACEAAMNEDEKKAFHAAR